MPAPGDTIIALASAPGRSERAVLRCSGPHTTELVDRFLRAPANTRGVWPGEFLLDGARPVSCPVLATISPAPTSYTGEDTAEFTLPANPYLIERVLDHCCRVSGVRRAGPGEFTARAYLNGRMSLDEAEGVAAMIAADSADDFDAARRLATGQAGAVYRRWAEELTALLALVEAGIDFTDQEDVVPIAPGTLLVRLRTLRQSLAGFTLGQAAEGSRGLAPLVALVGPPNAGKSTLFNTLLARPRSIVADEPGVTRDAIVEDLHLDETAGPGLAVRLADLPGLDACASGPAARAAQARAREVLAQADALLYCDHTARFAPLDAPATVPMLRVRTKADLPPAPDLPDAADLAVCAPGWLEDLVAPARDLRVVPRGSRIVLRRPGPPRRGHRSSRRRARNHRSRDGPGGPDAPRSGACRREPPGSPGLAR
ncbi:MAG: 50S ribosome-binding GTPase [Phycisphaerales bacterium]|nr:50S ribosome-binding GTPase [Phycisphaerales bacterium]